MTLRCAATPIPSPDEVARLRRERGLYAEALAEMTARYEQKVRELSLVRHTSEALRDCTDLEEVFRRLVGIVLDELAAWGCSLYLAHDSGALVLRARGTADGGLQIFRPGEPDAPRLDPAAAPLGRAFATGEVVVELAVPGDSPGWFPPETPVLLAAPLGPPTGCLGILALHARHRDDVPDDAARLLPILATQATIAIENAALYQRLKEHTDTLEARVRERTAALEHLNTELQAGAQQKAKFFAHFSHELRTPLNSILGFAELLHLQLHGPLNETQQRYLAHVQESGRRLLRLISDILDLAKVQAGRLSLHVQPVPLLAAAEQALAVMHPQASAKHLRMARTIPPDLPRVMADPGRLHQVLLNLLSNAVKFTPDGGAVSIMAAARRDPAAAVEIAVVDTGVGIPPEDQARLFQDFEQVARRGARQQGTGLGLSLSQRLVALHGGSMGVQSAPGRGTTFWFTLPAEPAAGGPEGAGPPAAAPQP